jgi:hypothetical protein
MIFKTIIIALLLIVIFSLGQALRFMIKQDDNNDNSGKVLKSLTWRIGLSVFIFILLLIGQAVGWIHPHGL